MQHPLKLQVTSCYDEWGLECNLLSTTTKPHRCLNLLIVAENSIPTIVSYSIKPHSFIGFVMLILFWIEVFLFNCSDKPYQFPLQFTDCI